MDLERYSLKFEFSTRVECPVKAFKIPELDCLDITERYLAKNILSWQYLALKSSLQLLLLGLESLLPELLNLFLLPRLLLLLNLLSQCNAGVSLYSNKLPEMLKFRLI